MTCRGDHRPIGDDDGERGGERASKRADRRADRAGLRASARQNGAQVQCYFYHRLLFLRTLYRSYSTAGECVCVYARARNSKHNIPMMVLQTTMTTTARVEPVGRNGGGGGVGDSVSSLVRRPHGGGGTVVLCVCVRIPFFKGGKKIMIKSSVATTDAAAAHMCVVGIGIYYNVLRPRPPPPLVADRPSSPTDPRRQYRRRHW